ncbi:MAG TPA: hypothetical protein VKQ32_29090 [Polyangia bacterium]|nr:hypothetical protein [Polyangia bacterium]
MGERSRGRWRDALVISSLLAAAGCSAGPQFYDLDQFVNLVIDDLCRAQVACNDMPDMETCLATTKIEPNYLATLKQDIASGKVRYDGAKATACADLLHRLYGAECSQAALAAVPDRNSTVCDQVFTGTVAIGGACFFSEDCAGGGSCVPSDLTCSRSLQCCPGTCQANTTTTVPVGGSCASGEICAGDSYCDTSVSGVAGTCKLPTAGDGAACSAAIPCVAPLYCDLDSGTGMGTCRRPAATGGACSTSVAFSSCDDGRDYCDQLTVTCTRRVAPGGDCASGQTCVGYTECMGSTCVAQPKPGEACSTNGPSCLGTVLCDAASSTCKVVPVGGACM